MLNENVQMHEDMTSPKPLAASPSLLLCFMTHLPAWGLEALRRDGQGQKGGAVAPGKCPAPAEAVTRGGHGRGAQNVILLTQRDK